MSDSVEPHRWQPTRLPCPWDSPGRNTGVGCHFLLQCMKVKSEREVAQSCPTLVTPWTAAHQALPSMGFSRQEYWSGVPLPSPIKPCSHTLFLNLSFISKNLCYLFSVVILGPLITPLMELSLMYSFYNLVFLKSDFFQCLKSFLETTQV